MLSDRWSSSLKRTYGSKFSKLKSANSQIRINLKNDFDKQPNDILFAEPYECQILQLPNFREIDETPLLISNMSKAELDFEILIECDILETTSQFYGSRTMPRRPRPVVIEDTWVLKRKYCDIENYSISYQDYKTQWWF